MEKKLQVFISSTFNDLKNERQKSVEAVLDAGHIPAGMELFKASDESQKQTIEKWIKDSDVYMLILGGRYGSIYSELEISYTQWEYELAGELGIPRFSLVLEKDYIKERIANETLDGTTLEMTNSNYISFKEQVMSRMVSKVTSLDSISGYIFGSLQAIQREHPDLVGWVKSDTIRESDSSSSPVSPFTITGNNFSDFKSIKLEGTNKINLDGRIKDLNNQSDSSMITSKINLDGRIKDLNNQSDSSIITRNVLSDFEPIKIEDTNEIMKNQKKNEKKKQDKNKYITQNKQGRIKFECQNNDLNPAKFEELIMKLELSASESEKEDLNEIIHTLRQELNKPEPKKRKIESVFDGLKNIKGTAEFTAALFSIWDFIGPLFTK